MIARLLCLLLGHVRWWAPSGQQPVERETWTRGTDGAKVAWRCWRCGAIREVER